MFQQLQKKANNLYNRRWKFSFVATDRGICLVLLLHETSVPGETASTRPVGDHKRTIRLVHLPTHVSNQGSIGKASERKPLN